jgi:hypothetical protein
VSKLAAQRSDMQRFNLQKLIYGEVREQYQVKSEIGVQLWMMMWT